jgi:hypothetical protein
MGSQKVPHSPFVLRSVKVLTVSWRIDKKGDLEG